MAFARRKAIYSGVFGGNRRWLAIGGLAWMFHWIGRLFGVGDPSPVYTEQLDAGQRFVVVHEPDSPRVKRKRAKAAAKTERRDNKAARREDKAARRSATREAKQARRAS